MVDATEVDGARGTYMVKTRLAENRVLAMMFSLMFNILQLCRTWREFAWIYVALASFSFQFNSRRVTSPIVICDL
jgi:hypothetical protein